MRLGIQSWPDRDRPDRRNRNRSRKASGITIAEEGPEDWAIWSPDGGTLYFTARRDGRECVWGQRIDTVSHRPTGDAFAALHLHGRANYRQAGWSAAADRIAIVLAEDLGNIWMMSRTDAR